MNRQERIGHLLSHLIEEPYLLIVFGQPGIAVTPDGTLMKSGPFVVNGGNGMSQAGFEDFILEAAQAILQQRLADLLGVDGVATWTNELVVDSTDEGIRDHLYGPQEPSKSDL